MLRVPSKPLCDDARGAAMRLRDFNTLTFNVVGTLIDFETGILEWFRPALRRYGAAQTDEEILSAFAAVEDDYQRKRSRRCCPSSTAA
jgi:hypothetical protein